MMLDSNRGDDGIPTVSVVIAAYNYARFLKDALESVRLQTFTDWECIVVDDASTDDTQTLARSYVSIDARFKYIRNDSNLGEGRSRNRGNSIGRGKYIAVLDADDWWEPDKLESQVQAISGVPQAVLCFTGLVNVAATGRKSAICEPEVIHDLDRGLHVGNQVTHSSVLISRDALEEVGGYELDLSPAADWDLWLRIMHRYGPSSFIYVPRPLVNYRVHGENMSSNWRQLVHRERKVLRRALLRGRWALRNPMGTRDAVDAQIMREYRRHVAGCAKLPASMCMGLFILLAPWRRWRWKRLAGLMELWRTC